MGLRTKFNLVLLIVFTLGLAVTGYISYTLLQQNAKDEVFRNAGLIMEATLSMRDYTQKQISPHLDYQPDTFHAPEVAILGVARLATKPVWNGAAFVPREMLPLSLSYDHRVVNGADAARFTSALMATLSDMRRTLL